MLSPSRLLILACSKRKRISPSLLPAIERYDGPAFQTLRKYLREEPDGAADLAVWVLSAQFGLIDGSTPIPTYDQEMTPDRAHHLRVEALSVLHSLAQCVVPTACFVSAGSGYRPLLNGLEQLLPPTCAITIADGSHGSRTAQLAYWLRGQDPVRFPQSGAPSGTVRLRGVTLEYTPDQIMETARGALRTNAPDPLQAHVYFVDVDGIHVPPKWLISQLSGLPVRSFSATEARRALMALGIPVHYDDHTT